MCDFGESKIQEESHATTFVGTLGYLPPERLLLKNAECSYDERSDVWSLGITLIELIMGHLPYIKPSELVGKLFYTFI